MLALLSLMPFVYASAQGFMHAEGKKVVDINGDEIILRGHAPGGWMIQEPYMMELSGFTSSQHTIRAKIESVLGKENTEEFYRKWLENGFKREDVKLLAEMGFNSIRLPMHYNLFTLPIEDEPVKGENTWLEGGFEMVDNVLEWCKEFKIYLILDMHGAPGGQGYDSAISDYDFNKPSLWESEDNKNKLVALWVKLAERYANEQYIGGYDLINEPNWAFDGNNVNGCNESTNNKLWNLYKKLIDAVRAVDPNHMLILEGNCWCNSYTGLPNIRNWDTNLCLEFHKYWTVNTQSTINFITSLRDSKNLPIWCGESGENSTKWYADAVKLLEDNGIGWSWWTWKKIGSLNGMCRVQAPAGYDTLKNYWENGGSKPSQESARQIMFNLADAYLLENCTVNRAVADALLRQPHTEELLPYSDNKVPGKVYAPDYDLGRYGIAYMDVDGVEDTHGTAGDYTTWNKGWAYRADGVDIADCKDSGSNGYYVGWTAAGEWMKYTIDVEETADYRMTIRYASENAKTVMAFEVDGIAIAPDVTLNSTSGWDSWKTVLVSRVVLTAGKHVLKVSTVSGGANLVSYIFNDPKPVSDVEFKAVSAKTSEDGKHVYLSVNKDVAGSDINISDFVVKTESDIIDVESVTLGAASAKLIDVSLASKVYRDNNVTLTYDGVSLVDADGNLLPAFSNMSVTNVAEVRLPLPGTINVEDYYAQNGLSFEKCEDTSGGATNFGYTDPGDYVDFLVNIHQAADYTFKYRTAAMYTGGKFQVQLFDEQNNKTFVGSYNVDATGGWQTWKTQSTTAYLPKGTYRLRIYIVSKEFNMNWFSFTNPTGIGDVELMAFSVRPNPCHGVANVNTTDMAGKGVVRICNMSGKEVLKQQYSLGGIIPVDIHSLTKGTYILQLKVKDNSYTQKIIVE